MNAPSEITVPSRADELVDEEELEVAEMTEPALRTCGGITPRFIGFSIWMRARAARAVVGLVYAGTPCPRGSNDMLAMTLVMDGPLTSLARGGGAGARKAGAGVGAGVDFAFESLLMDEDAMF